MKTYKLIAFLLTCFLGVNVYALNAPFGLHVTDATDSTLSLAWSYSLSDEEGLAVLKKNASGYDLIATLPVKSTRYVVKGLSAGTFGTYVVVTYKAQQYESSDEITARTTHHWSNPLLTCLQNAGSVSVPPTQLQLQNITNFQCSNQGVTDMTPVQDLINATVVNLGDNNISGSIPTWIGELQYLTHFYLDNNNLTGDIPQEIGNLTHLVGIYFNDNHLSGNIPETIYSLTSLEVMYFNNNRLNGSIPPDIGLHLPLLRYFDLSGNRLSGTLPSSLGSLSQIFVLTLSDNYFDGEIPGSMKDLTDLAGNSGLSLFGNCRLKTEDSELITLIDTKAAAFGGYNGVVDTNGHCLVMAPIIWYELN
jgi:Leucine-rich repeat (LRR) protein